MSVPNTHTYTHTYTLEREKNMENKWKILKNPFLVKSKKKETRIFKYNNQMIKMTLVKIFEGTDRQTSNEFFLWKCAINVFAC